MSVYPTPYVAQTQKFSEGPERDARGNLVKKWAAKVDQPVIGWAAPVSTDPKTVGTNRIVVQVELYTPEGFDCGDQDKVTVGGVEYFAIGWPEDYCNGPFGFRPGYVVNLRRVSG